jgi:hypothetical protein
MIDTRSIEALTRSLPLAPEVEKFLCLKIYSPKVIPKATAALARKGYIGCFPIARRENDKFVLRLFPNKILAESPICVALGAEVEGITIAPDLARFIAGRMAQITVLADGEISDPQLKQELVKFASKFGDSSSTQAVLTALKPFNSRDDARDLRAMLLSAADKEDPTFQALSAAWKLEGKQAADWAEEALQKNPNLEIPLCIYVDYHVLENTDADLTKYANSLVAGNHIFDSTYTSEFRGPVKGIWDEKALFKAIDWLKDQSGSKIEIHSAIWKAALAASEDPESYDGEAHLMAAREIATEDPELAYVQLTNSAAYYAHATHKASKAGIILAHELATVNNWEDLSTLLSWVRLEMDI